jgi:hypothetical protein
LLKRSGLFSQLEREGAEYMFIALDEVKSILRRRWWHNLFASTTTSAHPHRQGGINYRFGWGAAPGPFGARYCRLASAEINQKIQWKVSGQVSQYQPSDLKELPVYDHLSCGKTDCSRS